MSKKSLIDHDLTHCYTCGGKINPHNYYLRFNHRFCTDSCRDIFDEKNDYGHIPEREEVEDADYE
ncbi:hypothetical protein FW774_06055 [Pedobacter sp. BS3]|uniref:hypothetical protein n=1 Tax=Pedobacter sp. BS3 TaxID=2567937 RepID=UPI0011EF140A|nr:hypothetical protein [Pedobacter sp. BS3]TZF84548.1 hypothetical protein FW774_06055 [Pedobacter sp. BS3]